jgi:cytochrome c oxidase assembly factor CtaG
VLLATVFAVWRHLAGAATAMPGGMHGGAQALARAGGDPAGSLLGAHLVTSWQLDALAVVVVVLLAAAYATGLALLPVRAPGVHWPVSRSVSFAAGLAVVLFATNGSIAVYDQVLFTAHMVGHLALVMLAPALLVYGHPLTLTLAVAAPAHRQRVERLVHGRVLGVLTAPPVALASYAAVIVGTHLTGLMDVIMRNTWAGQVEHLAYLVVGLQFFSLVVGHEPLRWQLTAPARWALLAIAMAVDTFTGIVLLQGTAPVSMLADPRVPVDALSDTRTGGAIMWVGGDGIMAAVMIALVIGWLRDAEPDRRRARSGWLERARAASLEERLDDPERGPTDDIDEDESALASYNAWLAKLNGRG